MRIIGQIELITIESTTKNIKPKKKTHLEVLELVSPATICTNR